MQKTWPDPCIPIHGSPHAAADTFHFAGTALCRVGYVVGRVNYHGFSGFGNAFLDSITHRSSSSRRTSRPAPTGCRLAVGRSGSVFAAGGSYGGYMVVDERPRPAGALLQRLRLPHAGCFDWTAMFADDAYPARPGVRRLVLGRHGQTARAQSPHAFAKTMRTPTLVIHGAPRLPGARPAGPAFITTRAAGRARSTAPALVPRREPLDPQAAQQPALARRVLRLAEAPRARQ